MKLAAHYVALYLLGTAMAAGATAVCFDFDRKRDAAARDAWVAESTEAERVRVLGQVAQRRLDARFGE